MYTSAIGESLIQPKRNRKKHKSHVPYRPRLPCPACGFPRLIDTGEHTHSLTFVDGDPGFAEADYYRKCDNCKEQIGIKKIE
jgi:hypothetical protein